LVILYAALDGRSGDEAIPFFGVWVRVGQDPVPLSEVTEIVCHAVNNGARGDLLRVLGSIS